MPSGLSFNELVKMRQEEQAQFEATLADLVKTIKAVILLWWYR